MAGIFDHVLIPYNGTSGSEKAFGKDASLAISIDAKITILTCLEERHTFRFKTKTSKQEFEKEHKLVEMQHHKLMQFASKHSVYCNSKILKNGMTSIKILEFTNKHSIDLIVMTKTKLFTHYEKRHHHSTVENMFRNALCPTLIL